MWSCLPLVHVHITPLLYHILPFYKVYHCHPFYSTATYMSLASVITCDLVGLEKLTNGFGLLCMVRGITLIAGPPITGERHIHFTLHRALFKERCTRFIWLDISVVPHLWSWIQFWFKIQLKIRAHTCWQSCVKSRGAELTNSSNHLVQYQY